MSHSSACHYYELANLLNKHEKGFSTKPVLQSIIIVQQNSSLCRICLKIPWMGFVKQFREKTLNLIWDRVVPFQSPAYLRNCISYNRYKCMLENTSDRKFSEEFKGLSLSWSHGSWIYSYLRNNCLSPLMLWV